MIKMRIVSRDSSKYKLSKFISTTEEEINKSEELSDAWKQAINKEKSHIVIDSNFIKANTTPVKISNMQLSLRECANGVRKLKPFILQFISNDLRIRPNDNCNEKVFKSIMQVQAYLEADMQGGYVEVLAKVLNMLKQFNIKETVSSSTDYSVVFHVGQCTKESAILLHILINLGYKAVYVNKFIDDIQFNIKWLYKPIKYKTVENSATVKTEELTDREEIRAELKTLVQKENYLGSIKPVILQGTENEYIRLMNTQLSHRPFYEFNSDTNEYKLPTIAVIMQGVKVNIKEYYDCLFEDISENESIYIYKGIGSDVDIEQKDCIPHLTQLGLRLDCVRGTQMEWVVGLPDVIKHTLVSIINELLNKMSTRTEKLRLLTLLCRCPYCVRDMLANFQFAKHNPKLFIVITKENELKASDSLFITLLHRLCFDIVILQPNVMSIPKEFDMLPKCEVGEFRSISDKEKEVCFRGKSVSVPGYVINILSQKRSGSNEVYCLNLNNLNKIKINNYKELESVNIIKE